MKVIILSAGHDDSAIPMAKAISEHVKVELIFLLSKKHRTNNFINLPNPDGNTGLLDDQECTKLIAPEVYRYIDGTFRISLFLYKNLKVKSFENLKLSLKLSSILRKADIIHINGKISLLPHLKHFLLAKKFIYTIHDLDNHSGEKAKNILAKKFNQYIIQSKSHVVIQNKSDFEFISQKHPAKRKTTHFIPFGTLDVYRFFKSNENNFPPADVLFFGRISPYKGLEYFVEAMKMLKKEMPHLKYAIAGSGDFYFDDTTIQNDPDCYVYNRFIDNEELAALFKTCRVVVCPYIDATQSGVAMTAFTFNKPVIATNTGGFRDIIRDEKNGYLVPVKDSVAIFEKLRELFQQPEKMIQLEQNILNQGHDGEFSWKKIAENYKKVYDRSLSKRD